MCGLDFLNRLLDLGLVACSDSLSNESEIRLYEIQSRVLPTDGVASSGKGCGDFFAYAARRTRNESYAVLDCVLKILRIDGGIVGILAQGEVCQGRWSGGVDCVFLGDFQAISSVARLDCDNRSGECDESKCGQSQQKMKKSKHDAKD